MAHSPQATETKPFLPACHAGGRGFKSRRSRHNKINHLGESYGNQTALLGRFRHTRAVSPDPQKSAVVRIGPPGPVAHLWRILWLELLRFRGAECAFSSPVRGVSSKRRDAVLSSIRLPECLEARCGCRQIAKGLADSRLEMRKQ